MNKWKETINLPRTKFRMKGDLAHTELAYHDQIIQMDRTLKTEFTLLHGPAYANGNIHMGHALNTVIKDIICRAQTALGYQVNFVPGFDCHGLPIELHVDPEYKLPEHKRRSLCRSYAWSQSNHQITQIKRLGVKAHWNDTYLTMSNKYEAHIVRVFSTLYQNGFIKRERQPIHSCPKCNSTLANAEIIYLDKKTEAFTIAFFVPELGASVLIWTTALWTIFANQILGVNKNLSYVKVSTSQGRFILHKGRCHAVFQNDYEIIEDIIITDLIKYHALHPISKARTQIIPVDFVDGTEGTGIVHLAPSHGIEDCQAAKSAHIQIQDSQVSLDGYYLTGVMQGRHIFNVNSDISSLLGCALIKSHVITHSYPHCWRHKTPLFITNQKQWFINLSLPGVRDDMCSAVRTHIRGSQWEKDLLIKMIQERPDWCISRNRAWGVPIPLFISKKTEQPHPNSVAIMEEIASLIEKEGLESVFDSSKLQYHVGLEYDMVPEVLDVWFDSGCYALYEKGDNRLVLEGVDQFRGWFQSLIILSFLCAGETGFDHFVSHGFVLDQRKNKMSKSLGNVIDPMHIIKLHGADPLRMWVSSANFRSDVTFSEDIMATVITDYRKIRNTIRFLLGATHDNTTKVIPYQDMLIADRWILDECHGVVEAIVGYYRTMQFHMVTKTINAFCIKKLSQTYFEIIRRRLYTYPQASLLVQSAQSACYYLLMQLCSVLRPIIPFTIANVEDIIDQKIPELFYRCDQVPYCKEERDLMTILLPLRESIRAYSCDIELSKSRVNVTLPESQLNLVLPIQEELSDFFGVSRVILCRGSRNIEVQIDDSTVKCCRCWKYVLSLHKDELCSICHYHLNKHQSIKRILC